MIYIDMRDICDSRERIARRIINQIEHLKQTEDYLKNWKMHKSATAANMAIPLIIQHYLGSDNVTNPPNFKIRALFESIETTLNALPLPEQLSAVLEWYVEILKCTGNNSTLTLVIDEANIAFEPKYYLKRDEEKMILESQKVLEAFIRFTRQRKVVSVDHAILCYFIYYDV